jgi:Cdc6-like AAA superfamily ATPase
MNNKITVDQEELAELLELEFSDWIKTPRFLCIYGESGWGKTAIVKQTLDSFSDMHIDHSSNLNLFTEAVKQGYFIEYLNGKTEINQKNIVVIDH